MRSLRARMLAAMVVVAVVAAGLTAFIVRRQTVDAIRDAAQSDLETELFIAGELTDHAVVNFGWVGVNGLVEELADENGVRVAVHDIDGQVLADSDPGAGLPAEPTAFLDPAELFLLDEGITFDDLAEEEFDLLGEEVGELDLIPEDLDSLYVEFLESLPEPALLYLGYGVDELVDSGSIDVPSLVVSSIALLALAGGLSYLVAGRVVGPVRRLTDAVDRLGAGDRSQRVSEEGGGEVASLATSFNRMAEDIEAGEAVRARMVADVAHELRNPVGVLRGSLEAAQDDVFPIDRALVDSLHDETVHLARLIDDLQQLALADAGALIIQPQSIDVTQLAARVVGAHEQAAVEAGLELSFAAEEPLFAEVDPTRLHQVLSNLLANAVSYTEPGGSVTVDARQVEGEVVIAVRDTGVGLSPAEAARVFDRFWRADESRTRATGGTGVGLSICKELVEAHGGTLTVVSEAGRGSTFTVRLPAT